MRRKSEPKDLLQDILNDPFRRDVFLEGYATGNPIQLGRWHREKFYGKSMQQSFVENHLEFIVSVVQPHMELDEAHAYTHALFNAYASAEFVLMEKDYSEKGPLIVVPEIYQDTELVGDLGFDDIDYSIMHGTLKFPPRVKDFYKVKTIKECAALIVDRYRS